MGRDVEHPQEDVERGVVMGSAGRGGDAADRQSGTAE